MKSYVKTKSILLGVILISIGLCMVCLRWTFCQTRYYYALDDSYYKVDGLYDENRSLYIKVTNREIEHFGYEIPYNPLEYDSTLQSAAP